MAEENVGTFSRLQALQYAFQLLGDRQRGREFLGEVISCADVFEAYLAGGIEAAEGRALARRELAEKQQRGDLRKDS